MKGDFNLLAVCFLSLILVTGCATFTNEVLHDEIFTYETPYDRAYLQILEAASSVPGWTLEATSKSEGLIMFREASPVGERVVIVVKHLDKNLTSVEVAKNSQHIRGVGDLLKAIDTNFIEKQRTQEALRL